MLFTDFWDYILDPVFLAMFGLVLLFFAPLAYSVWVTWEENGQKMEEEERRQLQR